MSYVLDQTVEPMHPRTMMMVKRLLDFIGASIMLIITAPLLAVIAMLVACSMGRPVVVRQRCAGLHGYPFFLFKFRTMRNAKRAGGTLPTDIERLTWVGRLLQASHLDELPQCWNILKGEMSFVGPRPLFQEYLSQYTARESLRNRVRPGMTGWAQLHERQTMPFGLRLELDAWYVEHWSLALDLRILLLTIPVILHTEISPLAGNSNTDCTE